MEKKNMSKIKKTNTILMLNNITKTFLGGKIVANDKVSISVKRGEIHSLVGENGSGKSTLMSILFGLYKQDSGTIKINGSIVNMYSAGAAKHHKIGMVHQHFHLVDDFTVLDNILLGQENPEPDKNITELASNTIKELTPKIKELKAKLSAEDKVVLKSLKSIQKELDKNIEDFKKSNLTIKKLKYSYKLASLKTYEEKTRIIELIEDQEKIQRQLLKTNKINEKKISKLSGTKSFEVFSLTVEVFEATEIIKSQKLTTFGILNRKRAEKRFNIISKKFDINIDPAAKLSTLSVGARQMVEILKVL